MGKLSLSEALAAEDWAFVQMPKFKKSNCSQAKGRVMTEVSTKSVEAAVGRTEAHEIDMAAILAAGANALPVRLEGVKGQEAEILAEQQQEKEPTKQEEVWRPNFSIAGRPITCEESALTDKSVAFEVAAGMVLPKDQDVLLGMGVNSLKQDTIHHFVAGLNSLMALEEKHAVGVQELKDVLERVRKERLEARSTVSRLSKMVAELEKASKELEEALVKEKEERVLAETMAQSRQEALDTLEAKHKAALEKANEDGYNEALKLSVTDFKPIKVRLYQAGYDLGLREAGVADDSPLHKEVVVPRDFFKFVAPVEQAEDDDDDDDSAEGDEVGDEEADEETEKLYTIIKVARDEDLLEQIGKDFYFDLVDHDKVLSFCSQKQMPFNLFKEEVAKEFGVPVQFQRFWIWAERVNHTYRPDRPLTPHEESQSVGQLSLVSNKTQNAELKLFLEVELGLDLCPIPPPDKTKEDILLFFKLYDPEKEELRYVGRLFVGSSGKPIEILTKLNEMAGFDCDEELDLFEEVKFEPRVMCERLDERTSFRCSQIEDGDIICFQKHTQPQSDEQYRYPIVSSFLEYVKNRQIVHFRHLERPKEDDFCLELSKLHTYDDVVERVARKLGLDDPSKIRLTPHNCYSQQPKPHPIKYRVAEHLLDMLVHYNQISDILYYEVLDIPLPELQCLKTLKVAFHHAAKDEVVIHNIRLPKQSTVGDVLNEIKTKVELSHPNAELRLLEVFYHKIYKIFPLTEKIENINDQYWTLRAEEIPEEEKNLGPHDRLIHVYHFTKETAQNQMQVQNFGEPFFLIIHEGETLAEVKLRIQKKLQVPDEEFSKWKFAFLSLGRPDYLQDSDIVSSRFQRRDVYGAWEQYLGLEHSDTTPKRAFAANQVVGLSFPLRIQSFK